MSRSSSDSQVPAGPAAGLCKGKGWAAGRPPARWAFSLAISMASAATRGDPAESAERQAAVTEAAVTRLAMHGYHENKGAYSMADYVAYIGAMKAVTEAAVMPAPAPFDVAGIFARGRGGAREGARGRRGCGDATDFDPNFCPRPRRRPRLRPQRCPRR